MSTDSLTLEAILNGIAELEHAELFKVMNTTLKLLQKSDAAPKKKGSMPTGVIPPQLEKNLLWVDFVQIYGKANGWESFSTTNKKGETTVYEASVEKDGAYTFPDGKSLTKKHSMSLSKLWKAEQPELYSEFEAKYASGDVAIKPKVAKTEEELAAEKVQKAEQRKIVAAEKKAAVAVEKGEAKVAAEKPKRVTKTEAVAPVKPAKPAAKAKVTKDWSCANDGRAYEFNFGGKSYMRNFDNEMWENEDGAVGEWAGVFANGKIDDSVADPYMDE